MRIDWIWVGLPLAFGIFVLSFENPVSREVFAAFRSSDRDFVAQSDESPKTHRQPDPAAPAINNNPRIWRALSGDTIELDGEKARLAGVTCPPPDKAAGRDAKALLNTFLRGKSVECVMISRAGLRTARCTTEGKSINEAMKRMDACN